MLTAVLSELFQVRDVDDVGSEAGIRLTQGNAAGDRAARPLLLLLLLEAPLDEATHLAAIRPPRTRIVLPFPHHQHRLGQGLSLGLASRPPGGRRRRTGATSGAVYGRG